MSDVPNRGVHPQTPEPVDIRRPQRPTGGRRRRGCGWAPASKTFAKPLPVALYRP